MTNSLESIREDDGGDSDGVGPNFRDDNAEAHQTAAESGSPPRHHGDKSQQRVTAFLQSTPPVSLFTPPKSQPIWTTRSMGIIGAGRSSHRYTRSSSSTSSSSSSGDSSSSAASSRSLLAADRKASWGSSSGDFPFLPAFSLEKRMALLHHSNTSSSSSSSRWTRRSFASSIPTPRRSMRFFGAALMACALFMAWYSRTLWPSASTFHAFASGSSSSAFNLRGHHIPTKIWQVMFLPPHPDRETGRPRYDFPPSKLPETASWLSQNPGYAYNLLTTDLADAFVRAHFGRHRPDILATHLGLRNHAPRSDLMRYLLMWVEGGVYSDTDVTCLQPVDTWIPRRDGWRERVKAVVGIEGDSGGGPLIRGFYYPVQFGQWTVAAAPRHRLYRAMIDTSISRLADLCARKNTTIDQLLMTGEEIMNTTGAALWSEVIFAELKRAGSAKAAPLVDIADLSGLREPRLYDDILVLPIDYIASGVPHSGASVKIPAEALVRHHFNGSWRHADGIELGGEGEE